VPQIEVTFDIDANGILNVSARDKATSKQQNITITASSGLSKDEISRMKQEAEVNAAEDARTLAQLELRNQADSLIYSTERTLREHGDKVSAEDKQNIEAKLGELKDALKAEDADRIKAAHDALMQASHKLAEVMYAQAGAAGPGPGAAPGPEAGGAPAGEGKGDVIDAEFKDLGEKK